MPMRWRFLIDEPGKGAWNMAVDEALLEEVEAGRSQPVFRLYRWDPACLSLGFAQPYGAANASFCAANGVDVVRRPTGGRAVLHHLELTYSVLAPLGQPPFDRDLQAAYRLICEALVAAFRRLGVAATVAGEAPGGLPRPTEAIPCFVGPATGEVVVGSRKLVGSAMRRHRGAILQHGSILEDWDGSLQAGCLGLDDDRSLRPAVVTLADLLVQSPQPERVQAAFVDGLAATLGVDLEPDALSDAELQRAAFLAAERYGHERWTVYRDRTLPG
jgi:lipoyl(octanoyl) transferase